MTDKEIKMWQDDLDMIEMLRKENEKLKEQLSRKTLQLNTQREKFIKYLKDNIQGGSSIDISIRNGAFRETLEKYEEMIGGKK